MENIIERLHVGRGAAIGPLTIFPVWTEAEAVADYVLPGASRSHYQVLEMPTSDSLIVRNSSCRPLLFLEGHLIAGSTPDRIVRQSVLIDAEQSVQVDTAYAGMERWGSDGLPVGRRISGRVFAARWLGQREQRREVAEGFMQYIPIIEPLMPSIRVFPGQVGVVVGLDGHPILAEVFDRPETLKSRLQTIIAAVLYEALAFGPPPGPPTSAGRAQQFLNAASQVRLRELTAAGAEERLGGHSDLVTVDAFQWQGHLLHVFASNNKHFRNHRV